MVKLPLIELGKGFGKQRLGREIVEVGSKYGFFYVVGHEVDIGKAHGELRRFFSQYSLEEKLNCHHSKTGCFRGYSKMFEQGNYGVDESDQRLEKTSPVSEGPALMDFKEMFHIGTTLPKTHPFYDDVLYPENIWPTNDAQFKHVISNYYQQVFDLSNELLGLFAIGLGLPERFFLDKSLRTPMNSMNCIHYPPLSDFPEPEQLDKQRQLGIGAHTDFEVCTLLSQSGPKDPCLDILIDGDWTPVAPIEHAFVVNIGDMLARWSGDILRSTVHRARNHAREHRYSIAFFRAPDFDAELSTSDLPMAKKSYPPVKAGVHLLSRITNANSTILKAEK